MEHDTKLELETANETIRHYETLFFAHLTAFITVTAGIAAVAFYALPAEIAYLKLIAKYLGLLFGGVAWVNATIYLDRAYRLVARVVTLEKELGFKLYSGFREQRCSLFSKHPWLRPGGLAWHSLYAAVAIFWVFSILRHCGIVTS